LNPRTEPLLWIQLSGLAVFPLEALLLLVVLAGSDPGPAPLVEEVLCWALGGLAPALLLWRLPADVWSLLLAQTPALGRRDLQRRLSRLQDSPPLKLLGPALGALALLPLLIRLDQRSALAAPLWTSGPLPRLVALLLAALLLGLMLWQWQQVVQAVWMLSRREAILETVQPLTLAELGQKRLSPGIPLLLPPPLTFAGVADKARGPQAAAKMTGPQAAAKTTTGSASVAASVAADAVSSLHGESLPVKPEQGAANPDGDNLDQPVA